MEIISERYDQLTQDQKEHIVIHELLHIPRGFSGGFVPHKGRITRRRIVDLHQRYKKAIASE